MKMACISKDNDTALGLRLAGIESYYIENKIEIKEKVNELSKNKNIGIIVLTKEAFEDAKEEIENILSKFNMPLIVKI